MDSITCVENKRKRLNRDTSLVLRKGAWTAQEDMLLKNCIQKYGEGKWHLVPLISGLNRCRKSCRLRWLNYLRPNIKKGDFDQDEVDLMHRLHKLLGNRWSLIAGRLPGRTANDVKNCWNTHVRSRPKQQKKELNDGEPSQHAMVTILKPQPRTISKTFNLCQPITTHDIHNLITSSNDGINDNLPSSIPAGLVSPHTTSNEKINEYLKELFDDQEKEIDNAVGWSFGGLSDEGEGLDVVEQEDGQNSLFDFPIDDMVTWDLRDSNLL